MRIQYIKSQEARITALARLNSLGPPVPLNFPVPFRHHAAARMLDWRAAKGAPARKTATARSADRFAPDLRTAGHSRGSRATGAMRGALVVSVPIRPKSAQRHAKAHGPGAAPACSGRTDTPAQGQVSLVHPAICCGCEGGGRVVQNCSIGMEYTHCENFPSQRRA